MKRVLRIAGILVGVVLLALISVGAYIHFSGIPSYKNEAPSDFVVKSDSASIEEGARIASIMCANCHRSEDGKLGGAYMADAKDFGEIYAPNITQHPEYGITDYTDGELAYLLRTGIKKDGSFAPPYMVKFPHLSDEDMNAILAFLKSDHRMVQPSDNNPPACKPSFLTKMLTRVAFKPLPYPEKPIVAPDPSDKVAFGEYIATAKFECYSCHSASFKTVNLMEPEKSAGYFGGGNRLFDLDGNLVLSTNLTMDDTGLGKWTEAQFIQTVRYGTRPFGKDPIAYPMMPFTVMTEEEASAIWAYLETIPKISNDLAAQ